MDGTDVELRLRAKVFTLVLLLGLLAPYRLFEIKPVFSTGAASVVVDVVPGRNLNLFLVPDATLFCSTRRSAGASVVVVVVVVLRVVVVVISCVVVSNSVVASRVVASSVVVSAVASAAIFSLCRITYRSKAAFSMVPSVCWGV